MQAPGFKEYHNSKMERSIIFLLDRSGSMESCRTDTIGGFNACLNDQKALGGKISLNLFDHEYTPVYSNINLSEAPLPTTETFQPRGMTALLDAIGLTIKNWSGSSNPTVIILTDGFENSSKTYTKAHIKDLIELKTKDGWTFVYLGANQDAFTEAGNIGIAPQCTMNYDVNRTPEAFGRLSQTLSSQAGPAASFNFAS